MYSDILCFLVSSSHCSYFPIISFFAKISNRRAGAGPGRTEAGGERNGSKTGGGKGYVSSCLFSLPTQFISSSCSSSFPIVYRTITDGAKRDVTGPTRAAQQRGTEQRGRRTGSGGRRAGHRSRRGTGAGRVLRRAGGRRSGDGDLDERATTADEEDERASQGGRNLGNIAVALPPHLLRDMYVKYDKSTVIKYYPST